MKAIEKKSNVEIFEIIKVSSYAIGIICLLFWVLFIASFVFFLGSKSGDPGDIFNLGVTLLLNHTLYGVISIFFASFVIVMMIKIDKK